MPNDKNEFLTATRFYFSARDILEKQIQKIDAANVETPPTEQIQGSGKGGILQRQSTPTAAKMGSLKLTLGLTADKDIYQWYLDCNKNNNEASNWQAKRQEASIKVYDQGNTCRAEWTFSNCYPTSYTIPDFSAGSNDVAVEIVDISFEGITRVQ